MAGKLKVCIIGAEGWGTAIAAAVSKNVLSWKGDFDSRVHIYVYDDPIRDSLLSEVINSRHENIKYLPGIKLPQNLIAVNDLLEAAQNADILIFSSPHTFVKSYCNILAGHVKETAFAVSMTKGLVHLQDDKMGLVSHVISERLEIPCYSMMSAHSSMEMAQGKLCEVTVGCDDAINAQLLSAVLQTTNCRVISINDIHGVELCGTLKEIIGMGAGFVDGLSLGANTRVVAIHLCLKEMMRFIKMFFPSAKMSTFYETCGIANSVAATYVDKNVNFAKSFITTGKTFEEIEANFLHGRKILGPVVAAEVNAFLTKAFMQHEFPLFTAIHRICQNEAPPEVMLDALRNHPDLSSSSISHLLTKEAAPTGDNVDQVLDEVADALPKLRSCLDKILAQANSPNLKHLKVMDDWTQVEEHKIEKLGRQVPPEDSPLETEDIPLRLSAEASKIRDEIREGNVRLAFKMDANDGDRHVRLLLEESPEKCTNERAQSVISSRLDEAERDVRGQLSKGHFLDSSPAYMEDRGIPSANPVNYSPDILDLSTEETSELMDEEIPRISEKAKLESDNAGESGVRGRLSKGQFLDSSPAYMADRGLPRANTMIDSPDILDVSTEETSELKDEEKSSRISEKAKLETINAGESGVRSRLSKGQFLDSSPGYMTGIPRTRKLMDEENSIRTSEETKLERDNADQVKVRENLIKSIRQTVEALDDTEKMENLIAESRREDEKLPFARFHGDDNQYPDETTEMQQPEIKAKTEAFNEHMLGAWDEPLEKEVLAKQSLHHDVEAALDEVPVLGQEDHAATEERVELDELEHWQKMQLSLEEDSRQLYSPISELGVTNVNHDELLQDVEEAELQERARKMDEKRLSTVGDRKPNHNLSEVNVRHFRHNKNSDTDHHEWDWMQNSKYDNEEPNVQDETLSKWDKQRLDMLNVQLNEALQRDLDVTSVEDKALEEDKAFDEEKALEAETDQKRTTQEPSVPLPLKVPTPKKHVREGTPEVQTPPGSVPPPSLKPKPLKPNRKQPHRGIPPVEFGDVHEVMQPEEAILDHLEPEAKQSSKEEPPSDPPSQRKDKANEPPAKKRSLGLPDSQETKRYGYRPTTPKTDKQRKYIEKQGTEVSSPVNSSSSSVIRKGTERQVDYRGRNPFSQDPSPMDTSLDRDIDMDGLSHQRRKVVVSPPFNPPINPRVRVPRPPFDVRDHEYHTMIARPVSNHLAPAVRWAPSQATLNLQMPRQVQTASRPLLQMPSGVPRSPALTKILCALQIGLLATFLARPKKE